MVTLLLLALAMAPGEVAPMPRIKLDAADCRCPDDDARCRAKAALALRATPPKQVPALMPSAERMAAKAALERADRAIKATPKSPVER